MSSPAVLDPARQRALVSRMHVRVLLLPFLLGLISIVDRVNIGFAKSSLMSSLHLSDAAYGFGAGVLFLGYFALEVPSNKALERFGARVWLFRIAITWGTICSLTAFVWNDWSFYAARFLLGAAEAGLFPGVVLYITQWYPSAWRARAVGIFMACIPASAIVGGPVAGWIMRLHQAWGLADWQWLFLIEGLPAVVLGVMLLLFLRDSPETVGWLDETEKRWLRDRLDAEAAGGVAGHVKGSLGAVLRSPYVWLFTFVYFCYACGSYGTAFFLPAIIKGFGVPDPVMVGLINAVPYAIGAAVMVLVARHSDSTGERRLHLAVPLATAGVCMLAAGLTLRTPGLAYAAIIVAVCGLMASVGNFWARPTRLLAGTAAASGIAVVNSVGNIGGFVGPYAFGALVGATGSSVAGLVFLAVVLVAGAAVAFAVRAGARDAGADDSASK